MKFERINSDKFAAFRGSEISNLHQIVGGFKGETGTNAKSIGGTGGGDTDKVDSKGTVLGVTADGEGRRNDGFK